jgi:hypothetical protein
MRKAYLFAHCLISYVVHDLEVDWSTSRIRIFFTGFVLIGSAYVGSRSNDFIIRGTSKRKSNPDCERNMSGHVVGSGSYGGNRTHRLTSDLLAINQLTVNYRISRNPTAPCWKSSINSLGLLV